MSKPIDLTKVRNVGGSESSKTNKNSVGETWCVGIGRDAHVLIDELRQAQVNLLYLGKIWTSYRNGKTVYEIDSFDAIQLIDENEFFSIRKRVAELSILENLSRSLLRFIIVSLDSNADLEMARYLVQELIKVSGKLLLVLLLKDERDREQVIASIINEVDGVLVVALTDSTSVVNGIKSLSDAVNVPNIICVDFADIKTILTSDRGRGWFAESKALANEPTELCALRALNNLKHLGVVIEKCSQIFIAISANGYVEMKDTNIICSEIQNAADSDANIVFSFLEDLSLKDSFRVNLLVAQ